MAEIGSAFVTIAPSAKGFGSSLNRQVTPAATSAGATAGAGLGKAMLKAFLAIGVVTKATQFLGASLDEAREAQKVSAQTGAVLKSTGGIANVTAKQIGNLATSLSNKIGVDDEAIQSGENLLLTFTNVRNEAGKGNDIFNQATRTVQDMAAAFGGDAVSNSKILGKALNDPIKGVTALTRVGVSFTDAQKDQIKSLVESGKALDAQKIILGELTKETEGSAEAQVTASDKAGVALGNLKETIGTALLPVVDKMANLFTTRVAPAITDFITGMQDGTGAGGQFRTVLENIGSTIKGVVSFFNSLPGPIKSIGVEAALAAVVLPPLAEAVSNLGIAMATAGARAALLNRGLLLVAGVGGMVALTEGAKEGNKAVSLLGSTLSGAFIGGTIGSAIPGIGTALGALGGAAVGAGVGIIRMTKATDGSAQSAKDAVPPIDQFKDSLDGLTGSVTRATRELILQKLEQDGIAAGANRLGIATSDLIKATLGNDKAMRRVNDAYKAQHGILEGLEANKIADWVRNTGAQFKSAQKEIKQHNAILAGTDRVAKIADQALSKVGHDRSQIQGWQTVYTHALGDVSSKTEKTTAKMRDNFSIFGKRVDTTTGHVLTLGRAIENLHNKTVTITVKTNHLGGGSVTGGGGHSTPITPRTSRELGRVSGRSLADGMADGTKAGLLASSVALDKAGEKITKKVKEKIARLRENLKSTRDEFAALVEPISSNFTQGLFDFTTAGAFSANLATVKGTLTTLIANFKTLIGEGLNPGFLYKLFQEGGPALINSLAALPKADALATGGLFGDVMSLSDQLGTAVAGATDKGAGLENQTQRLEKKLDQLIKHVDHAADRTSAAVNGAASNGRRRGGHQGKRWAA